MNLDLRLILGWLFVILGAILAVSGALLSLRINTLWGLIMVAFGIACLGSALIRRGPA